METIGGDLRQMQRTPLAPALRRSIAQGLRCCELSRGHVSHPEPGQPVDRFVYVEER